MKRIFAGAALAVFTVSVQAQGLNIGANDIYFGGGLSSNELDGFEDNETGWQLFGGLDLVRSGQLTVGAEAGYMDAGEWERSYLLNGTRVRARGEVDGVWVNGVGAFSVTPGIDLLGRAGFDFGDDDGFMFGLGVGFNLNRQVEIRGEYVIRDHIDSVQANFVYHL